MVASTNESAGILLGLSNNLADAVELAGSSIVAVHARNHVPSSGVVWRPGVIVTADHTIDREDGITLTLPNGDKSPATVVGRDPGTDIAVLKIEGVDLPVAEVADDTLKVGHIVLAVGRPGESGLSASMGAISAVSGSWRTWSGGQIDRFVRPDLTMYPGFSGGPLVDAQGRVAGINTSGLSRNMALTIPASTIHRVVEQLLTKGRVARGYLGLGLQRVRLPDNLKSSLDLPDNSGLIVVSVEPEGPGDKAGVLVGDILVKLGDKPATATEDVQALLDPEWVGKAITAQLVRGGEPKQVQITVGERPKRGA